MKNQKTLMSLAFLLALYFLISSVLIHFLRPDLSVVVDPLSRFAIGKYSMVLTTGLFSLGICEVLVGFCAGLTRPGAMLMLVAGVCVILVGIFPMEINGLSTVHGYIHLFAACIQFLFFPISLFLMGRSSDSSIVKPYTLLTAVGTFCLFILVIVFNYNKSPNIFGLVEKIDILFINAWLLVHPALRVHEQYFHKLD
jgi:hypothetical membrane protein